MNCPTCKGETKVLDSRVTDEGVRRRRGCLICDQRFSTMETVSNVLPRGPKPKANRPVAKPKMQSIRSKHTAKPRNPRSTLYDDVEDYGYAADLEDTGIDLPDSH